MNVRIVILDKSFVAVGIYTQDESTASLDRAFFVRKWGTSRGLGEIAADGPTSRTVLDPTPKQTFPMHAVVNMIECDSEKWAKVLEDHKPVGQ